MTDTAKGERSDERSTVRAQESDLCRESSDEASIWETIRAANRAWARGEPRQVGGLFHENAMVLAPDGVTRVSGRDAVVQSYVDYCAMAKTHEFREIEHTIDRFGDVAIASYSFTVRYEIGGHFHAENGREILVLIRRGSVWRVQWRTQLPVSGS